MWTPSIALLVTSLAMTPAPQDSLALPFESQPMRLDQVLKRCIAKNPTLVERAIDVAVSESSVLTAMGQFDPQLEASLALNYNEQTPRGSTIVFSSGGWRRSLNVGVSQRIKTGGRYKLSVDVIRTRTDQLNFFNPEAGPSPLDEYIVSPRLELSHPLLRGMGIKVNTTQIKKQRLAKTQAQAQSQLAVQERVQEVLFAYWDLAYAQGDLKNKEQARASATELLEKTRAEVDAGRAAPVQIKAVEQSLASREQAVLNAGVQILEKSLALRELMAEDMDPNRPLGVIPVTEIGQPQDSLTPLPQVIAKTMKQHPQLRQLELALATRRLDEIKAINDKLPTLDIGVAFSTRGRSVDSVANPQLKTEAVEGSWKDAFRNFFNEKPKENGLLADYSVDASLSFAWDIRNRVATGQAQVAHQEILRAQLSLERISRSLKVQAIRTHVQRKVARKSLEVAQLAVELAKVNLDAEQARYEAGRSTNYDVLARIDEQADAENQKLQAQIQALKARVQEQLLTGELLGAYGIDLRPTG